MIEILFIVFWVLGLIFFWPSGPWRTMPWAPHGYYMLMLALVGLALFNGIGRELIR